MGREAMVQRNVDGVGRIVLLGTDGGERRAFFERAAREAGVGVSFYDWRNLELFEKAEDARSCAVKVDAPEWETSRLGELEALTEKYGEWLERLSRMPVAAFLNHPCDIEEALDKRKCKKRLAENGVPVTRMYEETFTDKEMLLDFMRENRIGQVFVKPVKGSGAAGVAGLRFSPRNGRIMVYTCAAFRGELFNTKRMYRLEGEEGGAFLDKLLGMDCVIERWYGKSSFQGYCYDLRVVVQDGQVDYILPRLSKGPITNLQLNNHSVEFERLGLDEGTVDGICEVCVKAAKCYPRLGSIGMDVLLESGSRKPYIIEINAQGDLLHKDIYGENRIYRRQIEMMKGMLGI